MNIKLNRYYTNNTKKYLFYFFVLFSFSIFSSSKMIDFQFHGKNLGDLIQKICQIKEMNIMLPAGTEKIETIVNFSTPGPISLEEAEEYLLYFLSMAGYMLTMQGEILTIVKKTDNTLMRTGIPLYVQVPPEQLPDNPGYIRVLYFLNHLRVPVGSSGSEAIKKILIDILPDGGKGIMVDPRSNAMILTAPSHSIAAAMTIINEIDNYGIADQIAILPLYHTSVGIVSKLLEEIVLTAKDSSLGQVSQVAPTSGASYFSNSIKIIPENKTNSLIFLGKEQVVNKIISFVKEVIDIPQESGNCTIHIFPLKYLDARKLAPVLQGMVAGKNQQESQSVKENTASQFRFFDNVLIFAEEVVQASTTQQDSSSQSKFTMGGNRLIIAATNQDYKALKEIIYQLDQPQNQVIIEIMVLDLTIGERNNFGSQTRLPNMLAKNSDIGFQSIMLNDSQFIVNDPALGSQAIQSSNLTPKSTINSDLLSTISSGGTPSDSAVAVKSLADNVARNGMIISIGEKFKNLGIASILQLEHSFTIRDVVANPHIITQNNTKAEIKNVQIRRGKGDLSSSSSQYAGGAAIINIVPYSAALTIGITPRISRHANSIENKKATVNLDINIDIEDFTQSGNDKFDKITRGVKTNSNINSGDLLVIGGLYKETQAQTISKTPFLGDIPIIGSFFRKTEKVYEESNLVIVIRVTVGEDFLLDDLRNFTHNQINYSQNLINESIFGGLKNSITHIDFYTGKNKSVSEKNKNETIKKLYTNYKNN